MKNVNLPTIRPYHRAKLIGPNGEVSPLCANEPKALDLSKGMWTISDKAVTCRACLRAIDAAKAERK